MRRAQQQVITFEAIDATNALVLKSGITFITGDVQISKDAGAFANVTNLPVEIGSSGVYALTLTAAETNCGWMHVKATKASMYPTKVSGATDPHPAATVVAGANTATTFVTDLTATADNFYAGAGVRFNSGVLQGQVREIASYNGATKAITLVVPLTSVPATGALFELVDS